MREKAIGLLQELTDAHGAPGFEDEVRAIFADELGDVGEISTDGNGSVFCELGEGPRVLLTGHMDEVAFRVQNITPEGFIQFVTILGTLRLESHGYDRFREFHTFEGNGIVS